MRFAFLLIVLWCSCAFANVEVHEGKITLEVYSQSLGEIVKQISEKGDVRFSLEDGVANQTVSASFQDLPVAPAIKKLLEGTGINFAVVSQGEKEPIFVFIGAGERPGSPPKRLDTRPVNAPSRGVVTPVAPPPSSSSQPAQRERQRQQALPGTGGSEIPTAGGYVPSDDKESVTETQREQQQTKEEGNTDTEEEEQ